MLYDSFFNEQLEVLKTEGRYRIFADLERYTENAPIAKWRDAKGHEKSVIVWCSNDYLGMSQHPDVIHAAQDATALYGVGSGGTRNISGTSHLHVELEKKVAALHEKEAGLVFTSGYAANEAALSTLGGGLPKAVFFCDEKVHASMIQGVRHSKAARHIFAHNDVEDLRKKLALYDKQTPKIIVFVSVYSMNGNFAPIKEICDLAKEYNALTYLDEVHAVGIYGKGGAGLASELGQQHCIDIIQGNFAKAYGVIGGYIAGSKNMVDYVRSFASGFIFTTSLPPMVAKAAYASISILQKDTTLRDALQKRVELLKSLLQKTHVRYLPSPSHIVPVIIGDARLCKEFTDILLNKYSMYAQPINYPTVPRGQECIRLTVTPFHTEEMIYELVDALSSIWNSLSVLQAA